MGQIQTARIHTVWNIFVCAKWAWGQFDLCQMDFVCTRYARFGSHLGIRQALKARVLSNGMHKGAQTIVSCQQSDGPFSLDKTSTSCVSLTPEVGVFDDPAEPLRPARIRFRLTKTILLAREQFMKNVWHCTRNDFGARKLPAEHSTGPKV